MTNVVASCSWLGAQHYLSSVSLLLAYNPLDNAFCDCGSGFSFFWRQVFVQQGLSKHLRVVKLGVISWCVSGIVSRVCGPLWFCKQFNYDIHFELVGYVSPRYADIVQVFFSTGFEYLTGYQTKQLHIFSVYAILLAHWIKRFLDFPRPCIHCNPIKCNWIRFYSSKFCERASHPHITVNMNLKWLSCTWPSWKL